jgi:hypothetical protein
LIEFLEVPFSLFRSKFWPGKQQPVAQANLMTQQQAQQSTYLTSPHLPSRL